MMLAPLNTVLVAVVGSVVHVAVCSDYQLCNHGSCIPRLPYSARQIVLTEQFDEGLMVLRRLLGWDMIDMTYAKMKVSTEGYTRWDGKQLVARPSFDDLSKQARQHWREAGFS